MAALCAIALFAIALLACLPGRAQAATIDNAVYGTDGTLYTADASGASTGTTLPASRIGDVKVLYFAEGLGGIPADLLNATATPTPALKKVVIPDSVTSIGTAAFMYDANLTEVEGGAGVTSIGDSAFCGTAISNMADMTGVVTLGDGAFASCTSLSSITLGDGLTSIPLNCFFNTPALSSVTLPATVRSVRGGAFVGSGVTTITLLNPHYTPPLFHAPEPVNGLLVQGVFDGSAIDTIVACCNATPDVTEGIRTAAIASNAPSTVSVVVPAHDWGEWGDSGERTADGDIVSYRTCKRCGTEQQRIDPGPVNPPTPPNDPPVVVPADTPDYADAPAGTTTVGSAPARAIAGTTATPAADSADEAPADTPAAAAPTVRLYTSGDDGTLPPGVDEPDESFAAWAHFGPFTRYQVAILAAGSLLFLLLIIGLLVNLRYIIWYRNKRRERRERMREAGLEPVRFDVARGRHMVGTVAVVVAVEVAAGVAAFALTWRSFTFNDVFCIVASTVLLTNAALLRFYVARRVGLMEGIAGTVVQTRAHGRNVVGKL